MTNESITISLSQFNQMCEELEELRAYKKQQQEITRVWIDGKEYCAETLLSEVKRLRQEVLAGAKLHNYILNDIRTEIEEEMNTEISKHYDEESLMYHSFGLSDGLKDAIDIIDKYKGVMQE